MDNCWDYNDGKSHDRMGRALADGYRQKVFLMTKIDGRTKAAAAEQIEQSLRALRTDVIDLVQIHEVIRMNDAERCFGPGGAIEALVAARAAGKLRFIGFTGHKSPAIHLHMLETARAHGFHFDTVQMPLNVMDAHYDSFERQGAARARRARHRRARDEAARLGPVLQERAARARRRHRDRVPAVRARPADVRRRSRAATRSGCSSRPCAPPSRWRRRPSRRADAAAPDGHAPPKRGEWEKYKTSGGFDGTAQNPWWLETASLSKPT